VPLESDAKTLPSIVREGGRFSFARQTEPAILAASEELRRYAPALWEAARGFPAAREEWPGDYAAVLLALDASITPAGTVSFDDAPHSAFERGVAVNLRLERGRIASARVAVAGAGGVAVRSEDVETALGAADPDDPDALHAACVVIANGAAGTGDDAVRAIQRASRR
jgi:CO/xanthine dehydrogenase FAD-binding subunit